MVLMVVGMEAHTTTSTTTTYVGGHHHADTAMHPTAHGGIVATSSLHLSLQHHYWHIHTPIRWPPCYPWASARAGMRTSRVSRAMGR